MDRPTLPDLLRVSDVQARYGLRDAAAARQLMRRAGGFVVARRVVVRADDLDAWERGQQAEETPVPLARQARPDRGSAPLAPGWWRD